MNLIRRFLEWWRGPDKIVIAGGDDEVMATVLSRAFESGNMIIANRRDDGSVEIEEIPPTEFAGPEWESDPDDQEYCHRCGAPYDGGHRCGACGNGDPLDTGEFDPETGEQW